MARYRYGLDDVVRAMNEVVDERPGKVDRRPEGGLTPRFVEHGQCACLVGAMLYRLGVELRTLRNLDREDQRIRDSVHPFWNRFDPVALALLDHLQNGNDGASPWGRVRWGAFRVDPYWIRNNPKFAYPGPWCTDENGHHEERYEAPETGGNGEAT